jgi:hypothetical protein
MKKKIAVAALAMLMGVGTTTMGFASGSIGSGNMSVFDGGQLVDKLSGQNPITEGSLLACDGKCMVKSEGISLVAADQAKFAIRNEDSVFNLYVQSGKVDYVINDNSRKIAFHTPEGTYTVADVIFNASSASVVKGFVEVTAAGNTEIVVTEGRLIFATGEGMKTVDANNKIVLAVLPVAGAGAAGAAGAGAGVVAGIGTAGMVIGGVVAAGVVTAAVVVNNNSSSDPVPAAALPVASPPVASPNS